MTLVGDSPDWTRIAGGGGTIIISSTSNPGGNGPAPFTEYVGAWQSFTVRAAVNVAGARLWSVLVEWFADAGLTIGLGSTSMDVVPGLATTVNVPCIAPYARITFAPIGGADAVPIALNVYGTVDSPGLISGAIDPIVVEVDNVNVGGGANANFNPNQITQGVCTLCVQADVTTWRCYLQRIKSGGAGGVVFASIGSNGQFGQTIRFGLPPRKFVATVINQAAGAANFNVSVQLDRLI